MSDRKPGAGWFDESDNPPMNTPEQRQAAFEVVKRYSETASLAELVAMLGLTARGGADA